MAQSWPLGQTGNNKNADNKIIKSGFDVDVIILTQFSVHC